MKQGEPVLHEGISSQGDNEEVEDTVQSFLSVCLSLFSSSCSGVEVKKKRKGHGSLETSTFDLHWVSLLVKDQPSRKCGFFYLHKKMLSYIVTLTRLTSIVKVNRNPSSSVSFSNCRTSILSIYCFSFHHVDADHQSPIVCLTDHHNWTLCRYRKCTVFLIFWSGLRKPWNLFLPQSNDRGYCCHDVEGK